METALQRIIQLINENNEVPAQVLKKIGLSSGAISDWKKGKGKPSTDAIIKFAEYYHVTTDYLLLGKISDEETEASIVQKQLNTIFVQLDEGGQRECLGFAKGLLHANNTEKK